MSTSTAHRYRAFPATTTQSSAEVKTRCLDTLQRELPLAKQRRDGKRAQYIASLTAHCAAGLAPVDFIKQHPTAHLEDPDVTLLYCLTLEEKDSAACAEQLGVPESALALCQYFFNLKRHDERLTHVSATMTEAETANHFALNWFDAIAAGADLTPLPALLVRTLLADGDAGIPYLTSNPTLCAALEHIAVMHAGVVNAAPASRQEWRTLQRSLLDYTDTARSARTLTYLDDLVAQIAENAAIDCSKSDVIGEEIIALIVQAFVLIQAPTEDYTSAEQAMLARLKAPAETKEDLATLKAALKLPENAAVDSKRQAYWEAKCVLKHRVEHKLAALLIELTGTMPADTLIKC